MRMSVLTINGVAVANPAEMTVGIHDLSSAESGRTQSGKMQKDVIARKTDLNLVWNALTWQETSKLLKAVESSVYLTVQYPDPKEGEYVTKTMYVGDRTAPALMLVDGREYWGNISFSLIER